MSHLTVAIAVAKTLTAVFGALVTYLALLAYRRTGAGELRALGTGFGVVVVGSVLGGAIDVVGLGGGQSLLYGVLVQSLLTALGFAIITYSLYRA